MKKITSTSFALLVVVILGVLLTACNGTSTDGGSSKGNGSTVNVVLSDFTISLDQPQTNAGRITFVVKNEGAVQHDFAIRSGDAEYKTPMIGAGETASLTVDLVPGQYTYICTVSGHEQLGMSGIYTITPK